MFNFRLLTADEIECRAARCTEKGVQLLLYKDARCDMNILDETVGAYNWQRKHDEHNNNLFCSVGIKNPKTDEWIWKEDAGAESNTEAEKGHASDSFKRACVNWGIGRELYTSPFIWINGYTVEKKGKMVCNERFHVTHIECDEKHRIKALVISDSNGRQVYKLGQVSAQKEEPKPEEPKTEEQDTKVYCAECAREIKPYLDENGKGISVERHVKHSMDKFGSALCLECIRRTQLMDKIEETYGDSV